MLFLLIVLVALGLTLGFMRYLGVRAMRLVYVDIGGLTLDEVVDAGTKASGSFVRRMMGRPEVRQDPDGAVEWGVRSRGSVMTIRVQELPEGGGFRVSGQATTVRISQTLRSHENVKSTWGKSVILTNFLYRLLRIPHQPRKLLRQRSRVLRAVTRAGQVLPVAIPGSHEPSDRTN